MLDWKGQVAIVTGGASGLGAATVRLLTYQGLRVAVFDLKDAEDPDQTASVSAMVCKVDVSDAAAVAEALSQVEIQMGTPRVLINCAGIGPAARTVSRGVPHDAALFDKTLRVNLTGSFNCASQVAARMAAADPLGSDGARGVIVNTASVAAYDGQIGQVAYAASKGGIVAMTLPMARDLADKGIRVCTIAPGLFLTPLMASFSDEVQASLSRQVPFPSRLGDPAEYAALVGHILANPMLNGEVIRLDGAIRMAPR